MTTVNETFKDVVEKLEKDIGRHKEYINAAPSLNYKRYVAVIHIVEPVTGFVGKNTSWTVRVTAYGVELNKNTTADNFDTLGSRLEAERACKKLHLIDGQGKRVKFEYEVLPARKWNKTRVEQEEEQVEFLKKYLEG